MLRQDDGDACLAPKGSLLSTGSISTEEFAPVGDDGTAPRVHGFPSVTRGYCCWPPPGARRECFGFAGQFRCARGHYWRPRLGTRCGCLLTPMGAWRICLLWPPPGAWMSTCPQGGGREYLSGPQRINVNVCLAPKGSSNSSHGWSEAEPVVIIKSGNGPRRGPTLRVRLCPHTRRSITI